MIELGGRNTVIIISTEARKVNWLTNLLKATSKWQDWDLNPGNWALKFMLFPVYKYLDMCP